MRQLYKEAIQDLKKQIFEPGVLEIGGANIGEFNEMIIYVVFLVYIYQIVF